MLQQFVLRFYRNPLIRAMTRSRLGAALFDRAYFLYKPAYEARDVGRLQSTVDPDAWIIDVGANIGFFTIVFACWLRQGKVLALEPEADNFRRLTSNVAARGLSPRVEAADRGSRAAGARPSRLERGQPCGSSPR